MIVTLSTRVVALEPLLVSHKGDLAITNTATKGRRIYLMERSFMRQDGHERGVKAWQDAA